MKMRKLFSLLLATCIILVCFVACNGEDTDKTPETSESTPEINDGGDNPDLEPIDGGGREFTFLGRVYNEGSSAYVFKYSEIEDTGEAGEPVNKAVVERNYFIEEKYNIGIVMKKQTANSIVTTLNTDVHAGLSTYDVVMPMLNTAALAACNGLLTEWNRIPFVDETKDYWMTELFNYTSIGGYHFFCPGDLNISAYNTVQTVFFNKEMHSELQLEDVYSLVKQNQWTLEKMAEMAAQAGRDILGDGPGTPDDYYGIISATMIWQPLLYSSGLILVTKDDNDIPSMTALKGDSERFYNVVEDITELMNTFNTAATTNALEISGNVKFRMGEALFWVECIYGQYVLVDMEADYGIVPIPTWQAGDSYISNLHAGYSSVSAIPSNASDLELAGSVLEDMAYYSQQMVIPEYYERTIHLRNLRDEQSYEMLDIIFEHIIVDPALIMSLTVDTDIRDIVANNKKDTIVSTLQSNLSIYETVIYDIAAAFCQVGAKQYGY